MIGEYCSLNGELIPIKEARVPVDNIEFAYGFGVYETLKVRKGILYFPEMHIERLCCSASTIGLEQGFNPQRMSKMLEDLVASVPETSYNVKMMLVGEDLYLFAIPPLFVPKKAYRKGVKVVTFEGERQLPQAKTLNMLVSYLAHRKAKAADAYDALLIDRNGFVREGTKTNLFYTSGEKIFTPPKYQVLDGVTRRTVIDSLSRQGIIVHERELAKEGMRDYEGYFLTSTSSNVLPVSQIDNQSIAIPELVRRVIKIYAAYIDQYNKNRSQAS